MPKNIICILSDQHRWDAVGYRNPLVKTPHLDAMASRGISFDHSYCTTQACVPSRASFVTGRYHQEHGMQGNSTTLARTMKTVFGHFSDHGYQTVAVGRTHHIDNGFHNVIRVPSGESYPCNCHEDSLQLFWRKDAYVGPSPARFEDYYETRITRTAIDFLRELHRGKKPFVLYVGYLAPHSALTPPEPYWSLYQDLRMPLPNDSIASAKKSRGFHDLNTDEFSRIVRGYYGMISTMDACIGMLHDAVNDLGIEKDTVVIYTSDHGEMLGDKGLFSKGFGYDGSIRIPLIAECEGTIPRCESNALVENVDIAPTLCDAAQVPMFLSSGRSLWQVCTGEKEKHRDHIYSYLPNGTIFRTDRYKWIHMVVDGRCVDEVYDTVNDPRENDDLSGTERGRSVMCEYYPVVLNHLIRYAKANVLLFDPDARQPELLPYFTS